MIWLGNVTLDPNCVLPAAAMAFARAISIAGRSGEHLDLA